MAKGVWGVNRGARSPPSLRRPYYPIHVIFKAASRGLSKRNVSEEKFLNPPARGFAILLFILGRNLANYGSILSPFTSRTPMGLNMKFPLKKQEFCGSIFF